MTATVVDIHIVLAIMRRQKKIARASKAVRKRNSYSVFVSHATNDKWLATTICEKIESAGASFFRDDRDIDGGDDIPDKIRKAIINSNELLIILTPESIDSAWVMFEAGAAWGRRKKARIVPVLCHVQVDTIPAIIKAKKAIPLNEFDNYLKELKRRVQE